MKGEERGGGWDAVHMQLKPSWGYERKMKLNQTKSLILEESLSVHWTLKCLTMGALGA